MFVESSEPIKLFLAKIITRSTFQTLFDDLEQSVDVAIFLNIYQIKNKLGLNLIAHMPFCLTTKLCIAMA